MATLSEQDRFAAHSRRVPNRGGSAAVVNVVLEFLQWNLQAGLLHTGALSCLPSGFGDAKPENLVSVDSGFALQLGICEDEVSGIRSKARSLALPRIAYLVAGSTIQ